MPSFRGIPHVDASALKDAGTLADVITALTQNVEVLMGVRGPGRAVTNDTVGVALVPDMSLVQVQTPTGAAGDVYNLAADLYKLSTDVAKMRNTLNALIKNMEL